MRALALALMITIVACKKDADDIDKDTTTRKPAVSSTVPSPPPKSDEERLVGYLEEEADILDRDKDDCDAMGDELGKWTKKNGPDMKALQSKMEAAEKSMSPDEKKKKEEALKKKYGDRLDKAMDEILGGALKCASNGKVQAALENTK